MPEETYEKNGWRVVLVCFDEDPSPNDPEVMVSVMGDVGFHGRDRRSISPKAEATCELVAHGDTARVTDAEIAQVFGG